MNHEETPSAHAEHRSSYATVTVWAVVVIALTSIPSVIVQGVEGSGGFFFGIIVTAAALVVAGVMRRLGEWTLFLGALVGVFAGWPTPCR